MTEYEIDSALKDSEIKNFDETLQREIFLTSFRAITAKKILLVAEAKGADAEILYHSIGAWLKKLTEGNTDAAQS